MHHGIGVHSRFWFGWLPTLLKRYRVVRLDVRGYGSSTSSEYPTWSLEGFVDDIKAVMKAAGAKKVHFVGESMGGTIGLYIAAKHPQMVKSVTVCACAFKGGSISNLEKWPSLLSGNDAKRWSRWMMPRRFDLAKNDEKLLKWFETEQAESNPKVVLSQLRFLQGVDISNLLPGIKVPLLVLAPGTSPFVSLATSEQIKDVVPGARIVVYPDSRHCLFVSHSHSCAEKLYSFIAGQEAIQS
jgi:pimeloyl-ACP methyl ester carboxylesterase